MERFWTDDYPVGSAYNFSGNIWGKGICMVVGHNIGSLGTRSLFIVIHNDTGKNISDHIFENQKFAIKKRIARLADANVFLGLTTGELVKLAA